MITLFRLSLSLSLRAGGAATPRLSAAWREGARASAALSAHSYMAARKA
jgi:hypothetical protein